MKREVRAIESEFLLNQNNDFCRMEGILGTLVRKNHVMGNFGWGNYKSLVTDPMSQTPPIDMLVELRKFFDRYYTTNRMNVVLMACSDLDDLEAMVMRTFGKIPPRLTKNWPA